MDDGLDKVVGVRQSLLGDGVVDGSGDCVCVRKRELASCLASSLVHSESIQTCRYGSIPNFVNISNDMLMTT